MNRHTMTMAALLCCAVSAQDLLPKAAPQARPVLFQNATVHTVTGGTVLGGSLWFADGRIGQVLPAGEQPKLPTSGSGAVAPEVIDLAGKHVYPGMIATHSTLGLIEIGAVRQSVDTDELGEMTPEALALTAINPDSTALPVARSNGVLLAAVFPVGGAMPGRASLIQLDGWTNADLAVVGDAGPVIAWPADRPSGGRFRRRGGDAGDGDDANRAEQLRQRIDDAFVAARAWLDARTADPSVPMDIRHDALVPALRGEVPVFVLANAVEQIESAVLWGAMRKVRVVIVGGHEARACAQLLVDHKVPVIVDGVHRLPAREDAAYDEPFTLPRDLAAAGVEFCIATGGEFSNERNLPYHAATAAAFGLDRDAALASVTISPARMLGVADRVGALAPGMDATLFVTDGDPFELTTHVEMAFVQGRRIDLRNKQTELAAKYRERYRQLREGR
ncbi:MAG: amidohydrolase family protein [Planctomycetes bacterium]|nr:amidohydrolase family protein [Planctomycetota bacterium]